MIEQLQGRELDAALARALGQDVRQNYNDIHKTTDWHALDAECDMWSPVRAYHDDLNAMNDVEDEIERRGMKAAYALKLAEVVAGERADIFISTIETSYYDHYESVDFVYDIAHATAEQKARAALAVLMEAK